MQDLYSLIRMFRHTCSPAHDFEGFPDPFNPGVGFQPPVRDKKRQKALNLRRKVSKI